LLDHPLEVTLLLVQTQLAVIGTECPDSDHGANELLFSVFVHRLFLSSIA